MNNEKILGFSLGLTAPWHVTKVELKHTELKKELHITIGYSQDYFVDIRGKSYVNDRVEREWRHLNFFELECYIHCKVQRILDEEKNVGRVQAPWTRSSCGVTLLFDAFSMCLIEREMPMNKAGKILIDYGQSLLDRCLLVMTLIILV